MVESDRMLREIEQVQEAANDAGSGRGLAKYRLLWLQRSFLFRVVVCASILSAIIVFIIPKRYESKAQLAPPDSSSMGSAAAMLGTLAGKMGGLTALAENALGVKSSGAFFVAILKSETVQDYVIRKFSLEKEYGTRYLEDARKELARHTSVSEDRESGLITIVVVDHDPRRAAAIAQEYINELNSVVSEVSTSSARRERIFLEARLEEVRQDLAHAEKEFSEYASQKSTINIEAEGKALVEAGATLQGQLIAAQSELEGLRQIYSPQNVRVRSLQARVDELRKSLERIGGKRATENSSVGELYPSLRELPLLGVGYADLFRKVKVKEAVFEALTQEYELAKVEEAREIPTVKILDPPLVPQKKSFPPRLLLIIASSTLAFLFGCAWILVQSAWDNAEPGDLRKALATEIVSDVRSSLHQLRRDHLGRHEGWRRLSPIRGGRNGHGQIPPENNQGS
jgi:capsule polysaccharide export protein KpsE/RkpR